ncbi:hypothetical protein [Nevskia ramosa]|uniref:hypothetical protein n=1 Tax=Nevskia ramosa TaxID=64002 RepID=UPI0003B5B617|nr:hypothetical protein [Nevskia ramosa]
MKLSRVVLIVVITAVVVYFGLNMMLPRGSKTAAPESAATGETVTETPAATEGTAEGSNTAAATETPAAASEAAPESAPESAPAPESTETAASEPAPAPEAPTEVAPAPAPSSEAPAESYTALAPATAVAPITTNLPKMSDADARKIAENIGRDEGTQVAVTPVAPATGGDNSSLSEEEARKIAENVASEVASRVAGESAAPAASEPAAAPAPKAAKPKPAPKPDVVASAPSSDAPKATSKPAAKRPVARPKTGNGSDVISSWWSKTGTQASSNLSLVYAGEASSEKAVVLMFNNAVDPTAASSHIKLVDSRGKTPTGTWSAGNNPRVLAFKGVAPGRYTVILRPELPDSSGKTLGDELVGPVYVH